MHTHLLRKCLNEFPSQDSACHTQEARCQFLQRSTGRLEKNTRNTDSLTLPAHETGQYIRRSQSSGTHHHLRRVRLGAVDAQAVEASVRGAPMVGGEVQAHHVDNARRGWGDSEGLGIALVEIICELHQGEHPLGPGGRVVGEPFKPCGDATVLRGTRSVVAHALHIHTIGVDP